MSFRCQGYLLSLHIYVFMITNGIPNKISSLFLQVFRRAWASSGLIYDPKRRRLSSSWTGRFLLAALTQLQSSLQIIPAPFLASHHFQVSWLRILVRRGSYLDRGTTLQVVRVGDLGLLNLFLPFNIPVYEATLQTHYYMVVHSTNSVNGFSLVPYIFSCVRPSF